MAQDELISNKNYFPFPIGHLQLISVNNAGHCEHISAVHMVFHTYVFYLFSFTQIGKDSIARGKGITTLGEPTQNIGDSRNNAHSGPTLQVTIRLLRVSIRPPTQQA